MPAKEWPAWFPSGGPAETSHIVTGVDSQSSAKKADSSSLALILLVLALGLVFLWLVRAGQLNAERVPDTPSYMEASRATSLEAALSHHRTIGFPTLIRTLYAIGGSRDAIPVLGFLVFFFGVLSFFLAVRRFSGSMWLAFAAALPLPFASVLSLAGLLQPDFLSAAFVLISVSCLLLVVTNTRHWAAWVGLGISTLLAYQFRPAAQFLVLVLPIFAGIFLWLRDRPPIRHVLRLTGATAAVTLVPFVLFCTLRFVTVGSFGLVSFGGSNLAASVVNFLDADLVQEVPPDSRDLARKILKQRRARGWETMRLDSDPVEFFRQGSDNLFRIARNVAKIESRRAAREPGAEPIDPEININVDLDRRLSRLATEIIRLRPALYLNWIRHAMVYGLKQLADYRWILVPALLLLLSLPIVWIRRPVRQKVPADSAGPHADSHGSTLAMLILLAVGYFSAYLLLVSATFFPFDRYFVSMTLFIPSALVAVLFETWRRILRG